MITLTDSATVEVRELLAAEGAEELALRTATDRFRSRFEHVERLATERSIDLRAADLPTLESLWTEAKSLT